MYMNIAIDARLIDETGVGRYIRNLIRELAQEDTNNSYTVFLPDKAYDTFRLPNARWRKVRANVRWHTLTEQLVMPYLFWREKPDLVHIPYHNPPVLYPGAFIVTIHDLIILHVETGKATRLPYPLYRLKRLFYRVLLHLAFARARHIIAVSETTKREITDHFRLPSGRVTVTYEAADPALSQTRQKPAGYAPGSYGLYVGNAYPHKNLERLVTAWKDVSGLKLVLVTPDDIFTLRLKQFIEKMNLSDSVILHGPSGTDGIGALYTGARLLVFPSLMEGFGLPGIEAMALGVPVVVSDIPVFREIYGDACVMFDPENPRDIAAKVNEVAGSPVLQKKLTTKGKNIAAGYSWKTMAKKTMEVYAGSTGV